MEFRRSRWPVRTSFTCWKETRRMHLIHHAGLLIFTALQTWYVLGYLFTVSEELRIGPRQANLVLIAYASSEGSGEPAHQRSLARTSAARSYKQWIKRNRQTVSQIPGLSEVLGMRSKNLSWRNARTHKFAWRATDRKWIVRIGTRNIIRGKPQGWMQDFGKGVRFG